MTDGLLGGLSATELRSRTARGELSCAEVAQALLEAVGDDPWQAWGAIDPLALRSRAEQLDRVAPADREGLALFGVPVAIKDNFDTADLVTTYGSPIYAEHRPATDAAVVARLRRAGALIAGKTRCTEFAWMAAAPTLNPNAPGRTPGGSSSGSAAAVAAGTVPLATGTQTAGSMTRPGSYCGVLGYKPTFGRFPRDGVKPLAHSLDTVGLFAREVADLELAGSVLAGPRPGGDVKGESAARRPPWRLGWAPTPWWPELEPEAAAAIEVALERLRSAGCAPIPVQLSGYVELADAHTTIQFHESARALARERETAPELLSEPLRAALEHGAAISASEYEAARRVAAVLAPALVARLREFDGVLTPSAGGLPPLGLSFTGDPAFCRTWTLIGAPSVSVPLARATDGTPAPLQLVAAPGRDHDLLTAAAGAVVRQ